MATPENVADLIENYFLCVSTFRRGGAWRWSCRQGGGPEGAVCPYPTYGAHGDTLAATVLTFLRAAHDRYDTFTERDNGVLWKTEKSLAWRRKVDADLKHF